MMAMIRPVIALGLATAGLFQMALPVFALGTAAGQAIRNTATATYEDPNNPGVPINATSNQVTVTVAEVAGVTNTPAGLVDDNGGSVTTGDAVDYSFLITNTGNDPTAFHIPFTPTIIGGSLGNSVTGPSLVVTEVNGVVLTTPVALPANGFTDDTTSDANNPSGFVAAIAAQIPGFDGSVPANGTFKVVVPVTVTETVAGNPVSVQLGNTGANDNSAGTQNQPDDVPLADTDEVYTRDVGTGSPVNGVREASAFQTVPLATQVNNLALATVLKTRTAYNPAGPGLTDDTLTYRLDLRVESAPPAGTTGITPAPLLGTDINLDATPTGGANGVVTRVLVSDAIPVDTTLDTSFTPAGIPAGWTRVYTNDPTTVNPLAATWRTGAFAGTVTRIGYIANGPLAAGTTTVGDANGFQFRVITTGIAPTGGTVANLAQVLGQTTAGPISPTNPLVYDESGDQNPNNYEAGVAPAPITTPATSPTGVANITNDGTDPNNNNTGTGPNGEDNIFTVNPPGIILNGPPNQPGALGPNNSAQTDFVNKSASDVPAGIVPGTAYDPAPITFTNTVQNPPSNTNQLDNVTLEPISSIDADAATGTTGRYVLDTDANGAVLPTSNTLADATQVTIAYPVGSTPTGTGRTALYQLRDDNHFHLISSTTAGVADVTPTPIRLASLAVGVSQDYNVTINLPGSAVVTTGYSVPIVSYVDSNTTDGFTFKNKGAAAQSAQDTPFNIKIDRVYTGYLNLRKESKLLQGTGPALSAAVDDTFGTPNFSTTDKNPAPGNIIQYRITYENISTPPTGTGNVILNANNIVITEDGAAAPNNWAGFTVNVPSTAADSTTGTITYFVGGTASTTTDPAITRYLDSIPTLAPAGSGQFTFQRQLN